MADFSHLAATMDAARGSKRASSSKQAETAAEEEEEEASGFGGDWNEGDDDDTDPNISLLISQGLSQKHAEIAAAHYKPIIQTLQEDVARLSKVCLALSHLVPPYSQFHIP